MGDSENGQSPVFKDYDVSLYNKEPFLSGDRDDLMKEAQQIAMEAWKQEYRNGQRYHHPVFDDENLIAKNLFGK